MRVLFFDDSDLSKKRFEFLFRGLLIIGNQNTQKGLSVLAREIDVLDKLEAISTPCNCGRLVGGTKEPDRELKVDAPQELKLEDAEFDLLYQYVGSAPWALGDSSRNALKTLIWLKQ